MQSVRKNVMELLLEVTTEEIKRLSKDALVFVNKSMWLISIVMYSLSSKIDNKPMRLKNVHACSLFAYFWLRSPIQTEQIRDKSKEQAVCKPSHFNYFKNRSLNIS